MSHTSSPVAACKTVAAFLEILKDLATHELAMPNDSLETYRAFATDLDTTIALCDTEAPTVDDCTDIENFLADVGIALLDGELFPNASRRWKQAFLNAIEYAGMACAEVTGSLKGLDLGNSLMVH